MFVASAWCVKFLLVLFALCQTRTSLSLTKILKLACFWTWTLQSMVRLCENETEVWTLLIVLKHSMPGSIVALEMLLCFQFCFHPVFVQFVFSIHFGGFSSWEALRQTQISEVLENCFGFRSAHPWWSFDQLMP